MQIFAEHATKHTAARGDPAVYALDITDTIVLFGAEMAAADDDQIVAMMGCRRQSGRIEQGADATEIEGWAVVSVAK